MILSLMIFLVSIFHVPYIVKALFVCVLLISLAFFVYALICRITRTRKHRFLYVCLITALIIDIFRLIPYVDYGYHSVSLELVETVPIEKGVESAYAFSCYRGGNYNREPGEIAKEISYYTGEEFTPIEPDGYTYIYVVGQEATSISVSIWDSLDFFPIPFKPVVYLGTLNYDVISSSSCIYIYRIPYCPLEIRGFC